MNYSKFVAKEQQIEYLICRNFRLTHLKGVSADRLREPIRVLHAELDALAPEILADRYNESRELERKDWEAKLRLEESQRPFNLPNAKNVDYNYWGKVDYWTIDEGVALILERAPEVVTWDMVQPHTKISPFAIEFQRVRQLAMRTAALGGPQLAQSSFPTFFLQWAKSKELPLPPILEAQVTRHAGDVIDWRQIANAAQATAADREARVAQLEAEARDAAFYPEFLPFA